MSKGNDFICVIQMFMESKEKENYGQCINFATIICNVSVVHIQ